MNYSKLKVVDLKKLLTERGLTTKGLKADLVKRLEENDLEKQNGNNENNDDSTTIEENVDDTLKANTEIANEEKAETLISETSKEQTDINNEKEMKSNKNISNKENIEKDKEIINSVSESKVDVIIEKKIIAEDKKDQASNKQESIIPTVKKGGNIIAEKTDEILKNTVKTQETKEQVTEVKTEKLIKNIKQTKEIKEQIIEKKSEENIKNIVENTEEKKEKVIEKKSTEINSINNKEFEKKEKEIKKIPKDEHCNNFSDNNKKEKESDSTLQIVGKSHKENESNNISSVEKQSKKRALNSEENINDPSKRKKVEEIEKGKDQKPNDTILINNFVRPLVTRSVKELVGKYGDVKSFWMDSIKTHAFVTYTNVESAEAAFKGINGIKFPEETGKILSVEYISEEESKERIKKEDEKKSGIVISGVGNTSHRGRFDSLFSSSSAAARIGLSINSRRLSQTSRKSETSPFSGSPNTATSIISPSSIARAASHSIKIIGKTKENSESLTNSSSPTQETFVIFDIKKSVKSKVSSRSKRTQESSSEVSFLHGNSNDKRSKDKENNKIEDSNSKSKLNNKGEEKSKKTMDDLFKKTKATPVIYYRPLTEEEVKKKEQREKEERIRARERLKERDERERLKEKERENKRSRRY